MTQCPCYSNIFLKTSSAIGKKGSEEQVNNLLKSFYFLLFIQDVMTAISSTMEVSLFLLLLII